MPRDSLLPLRYPLRRLSPEWPAQLAQQPHGQIVPVGGRNQRDVHPVNLLDPVVIDLREDHLLLDAEGIVAPAVEAPAGQAPEVTNPRDRQIDEAVEELVH